MPMYYFDVIECGHKLVDETGSRLPSPEAARDEAASSLGEMCRDGLTDRRAMEDLSIAVREDTGRQVLVASPRYSLYDDLRSD